MNKLEPIRYASILFDKLCEQILCDMTAVLAVVQSNVKKTPSYGLMAG